MKKAILTAGDVVLELELTDTPLADAIYQTLPLEGKADHWGEECHFATDVNISVDADSQDVFDIGAVVFIPGNKTIAIGFGPTLWSEDEEVRYEHPGCVWAICKGDASQLIFVPNDSAISITAA